MQKMVFFTIVANNYGAYALTLMESIAKCHPDSIRYIIVCDEINDSSPYSSVAKTVCASDLGLSDFYGMALHYDVMEFATSVKPFTFQWLWKEHPTATVVYLDPDILVTAPLDHVERAIEGGASLVLTPHLTAPLQDGALPDDLTIMKSGIYNLGFAAAQKTPEAEAFIQWWADRCQRDAIVDIADNKFTDQRWVDMAPAFVSEICILRHHSYNLAYWNLAHRRIELHDGQYMIDGEALRFVHFSGVNPGDPTQFSKHQNRFTLANIGDLKFLFQHYISLLRKNGWDLSRNIPYAFGAFPSGRKIHPFMRASFRRHRVEVLTWSFMDDGRTFDSPEPELSSLGPPNVTRVMYELWQKRSDLRATFDLKTATGRERFLDWLDEGGGEEAGFDESSIQAARALRLPQQRKRLRTAQPWAPQHLQSPPDRRVDMDAWLAAPVPLNVIADFGGPPIPRHLALVWEQRQDLRDHFGCQNTEELNDYLVWCLTNGVLEQSVLLELVEPSVGRYVDYVISTHGESDFPVTRLLSWMSSRYDGKYSNYAADFPKRQSARLFQSIWFLGKARSTYGWPKSFTQSVSEWAKKRSSKFLECSVPISNLLYELYLFRADVRQAIDIDAPDGPENFLSWVIGYGLREMVIPIELMSDEFMDYIGEDIGPSGVDYLRIFDVFRMRQDHILGFDHRTVEGARQIVKVATAESVDEWSMSAWLGYLQEIKKERGVVSFVSTQQSVIDRNLTPRVVLTGLVQTKSGRGEDVRMTAAALASQGWSYSYVDRYQPPEVLESLSVQNCAVNIVHLNAETALADYIFFKRARLIKPYAIGYWAWELSRFPDRWMQAFGVYDEIWTSTSFAFDSIASSSNKPVILMPMVVTMPEIDSSLSRSDFGLPDGDFIFYFGFDFRSHTSRKNPKAAILAFRLAFPSGNEPAVLFIKTLGAKQHAADMTELVALTRGDRRIFIVDREYNGEKLATLISLCDCFLSLHRSEGFGRGPAEAMLLGKPVIATGYSGNMDFMSADNSIPVHYKLVPVEAGEYPGWEGQVWADADVEHAAHEMRRVMESPDLARKLGQSGRSTIKRMYNPDTVGEKLVARLRELGVSN